MYTLLSIASIHVNVSKCSLLLLYLIRLSMMSMMAFKLFHRIPIFNIDKSNIVPVAARMGCPKVPLSLPFPSQLPFLVASKTPHWNSAQSSLKTIDPCH